MKPYSPRPESMTILNRAMEHIRAVPYTPSTRWVFYRLHQEGLYPDKNDYRRWKELSSDARKRCYGEWRPWTLTGDTRDRIERVNGLRDMREFKKMGAKYIAEQVSISFNHFYQQKEYLIVGFEARAMVEQFLYYSRGVDLLPFGGDPSVSFKWDIAEHFIEAAERYKLPVTLLYFGDYDKKGFQILEAAMKDIQRWCDAEITVVRGGLTKDQIKRYAPPGSSEKKGDYQWKALTDAQAKEIIEGALLPRLNVRTVKEAVKRGERLTKRWRENIEVFCARHI